MYRVPPSLRPVQAESEPRRRAAWWKLGVTGSADDAGAKTTFAQLGQRATWSVGQAPQRQTLHVCTVAGVAGVAYAAVGVCQIHACRRRSSQHFHSASELSQQAHFWSKECSPAAKGWRCSACHAPASCQHDSARPHCSKRSAHLSTDWVDDSIGSPALRDLSHTLRQVLLCDDHHLISPAGLLVSR